MKEVHPWLVRWAGTIDFSSVLAAHLEIQNIIFLTAHFFALLVPIAQQYVHFVQAVVLVRLSLCL
jgi:hypothetical protein